MANDEALIEFIKVYDAKDDYVSITYVCIRGFSWNNFGVMTATNECLSIYLLNPLATKISPKNAAGVILAIPYSSIKELKIKKFFLWNNFKIQYIENDRIQKIKLMISSRTVGIKKQKENVKALIELLRNVKQKFSLK